MKVRTRLARFLGIIFQNILRNFPHSKGETAPGLLSLKIDPKLVANTHGGVTQRIIITGTNGKTTTTKLVSALLQKKDSQLVTNTTGSNLLRGVATSSLRITPNTQTVIWEADEAALIPIAQQVQPTMLVITNLFRDQLDRYGEIDTVLDKWITLLNTLPSLELVLNGDDPSLVYLAEKVKKHRITFFGLDYSSAKTSPSHSADAIFCPHCHNVLTYKNITYSHLGTFVCSCGFRRPKIDFAAKKLSINSSKSLAFWVGTHHYHSPLIGMYNLYNCLTAVAVGGLLAVAPHDIKKTVTTFVPATGRQEQLTVKGKRLTILLVKNPTGFNQALNALALTKKKNTMVIVINDNIADSKDVSWLWDVNFEKLRRYSKQIIVSGGRALDMGLRLKYAGFNNNEYKIEVDKTQAMKRLLSQPANELFLLPTYTALSEMKQIIKQLA